MADRLGLIVVLALYLAMVVLTSIFRFSGPGQGSLTSGAIRLNYLAPKKLEPNYRLRQEDLARPASIPGAWGWFLPDPDTLTGKYVKNTIDPNHQIDASNLEEKPELQVSGGLRLVVFPLDPKTYLCGLLNAGSYVDAMGPTQPVLSKLRVHAVEQPPSLSTNKAGDSCLALLEVPTGREALLAPDKLSALHLLLTTN